MNNNLNTPWARLSQKEKAELIGIYTKHGYNELASIINNYNSYKDGGPLSEEEKTKLINRINSTSKADFVERLKDPNRKTIPYGDGVATHRLAYATDDTGTAIVYPEVQSYGNTLKEFVGRDAIERAIERRDTLNMSTREADWFTKHYKEYYPGFNSYKDGGDKGGVLDRVRKKLYDNVNPYGYERYWQRILSALRGKRDPDKDKYPMIRDDIFATYLQIPEGERHTLDGAEDFQKEYGIAKVRDSKYAPTIGGENKQYKAIDLTNKDKFYLVYDALNGNGKPKVSETLTDYFGPHTVSLGFDNNGQYVSYYDKWDLNPSFGRDAIKNTLLTRLSRKDGEDSTLSVGKPIDFYDRVYLDDYFGVDSTDIPSDSYYGGYIRPAWIQEVPGVSSEDHHLTGDDFQGGRPIPIRIYANGGKIHIKESKKGTFTAASKSRGMGVQEFASKVLANKDKYSPVMVKKANFAHNAAKWHAEGGYIYNNSGPLFRRFDEGGEKLEGEPGYMWDPGTQVSPQIESAVNYIPMKFTKLIKLKNGIVAGISDITEDIKSGQPLLYNKDFGLYNKRLGLRERFYKNKSNDDIFMVNPEYINSPLDPEIYTEISLEDVRKMLPKRDYIGGDNYRINTAMKIPGFTDKIYERATAYGVDPNLMLHRILKEGYIDSLVKEYNNGPAANQKDFFSSLWDRYINGFEQFGLDDAGSHLLEGKYELLDPNAKWREFETQNEQGRPVKSVTTDDLSSAIEILAAEMAYRQNELKKRGITPSDLGIYTNAAFNMGLYNDKLKDSVFVKKNYSYEPYYTKYQLRKKQ